MQYASLSADWRARSSQKTDYEDSARNNIFRLRAFLTGHFGELNLLTVRQGAMAFAYDRTEMNEQVLPLFTLDETVTLTAVEPLHGSCLYVRHCLYYLKNKYAALGGAGKHHKS